MLLCLRDLTMRRRFELASGREARFRTLVHNAGSVIMLVSATGLLESASGAITRLLGHDPELIEMRPLTDIVAEPDRRAVVNALFEAGAGATAAHPVTIRVGLRRHDGETIVPFELSIVDLVDDPTVEGFVISAHDASAQVAAEHELSEALSLLTATLNSTADGILVVDNDGAITGLNRRLFEIWRIAPDFVTIGDDATKLAFVLDQLLNPADLSRPAEGARPQSGERKLRHARVQGRARHRADLEASDRDGQNRRSGLELSRRHRPHPAGGRARVPGIPRFPDRSGKQGAVPGPPRARTGADRSHGHPPGRAVRRPRRLQDGERQPGAR